MANARILDLDDTVIRKIGGRTLLENLLVDHHKMQHGFERMSLAARAAFVKTCRKIVQGFAKGFWRYDVTGETFTMKICNLYYMQKTSIPYSFMQKRAKTYSKYLTPEVNSAIKNCNDHVFVVTSEPTQLAKEVFIAADNLETYIHGFYGPSFKIENGQIVGFERSSLKAGIGGKTDGLNKVSSNGYKKIYAIGDSIADIGLFEAPNVIPFTFADGYVPKELKDFVLARKGHLVNNLPEFFSYKE